MAKQTISLKAGMHAPDFKKINRNNKNFKNEFWGALQYAYHEFDSKYLKSEVIKYCKSQKQDVTTLLNMNPYHFVTLGKLCYILNNGGELYNVTNSYLDDMFIALYKNVDKVSTMEDTAEPEIKVSNIQDNLKEQANKAVELFDDVIDEFTISPSTFNLKSLDAFKHLTSMNLKAGHARYIIKIYTPLLDELQEAQAGTDEQITEAYATYTKTQIKTFISIINNIITAANMLIESSKAQRKPRKKKVVTKEKIVSKMKYLKSDTTINLISINPAEIIGASELWVYNVKTRRIGRYIAADAAGLSIKNSNIENFSEINSIEKTLRKPSDQIRSFKAASKTLLKTFMNTISTVDTKISGRISTNHILLRVV